MQKSKAAKKIGNRCDEKLTKSSSFLVKNYNIQAKERQIKRYMISQTKLRPGSMEVN